MAFAPPERKERETRQWYRCRQWYIASGVGIGGTGGIGSYIGAWLHGIQTIA